MASVTASFTSTSDVPIEATRLGIMILDYFDEVIADYEVSLLGLIEPGATTSISEDVPLIARRTPLIGFIRIDAARLSDGRFTAVHREDVERMMGARLGGQP